MNTESDLEFRTAASGDFPELMRLYRQLQPNDPVLSDGSDLRVFEQILNTPWLHLFVLADGDRLRATCYLNLIPNITRSARPYAIIENVVTDESHRQQGLGRLLMSQTLDFAWQQGCYKALLQTGSKTPGTHAFYRACGFSDTDKTGYVARPPAGSA